MLMSESIQNVIDADRQHRERLPSELDHKRVVGHRYTGVPGCRRAYQVTFDQTWVPYDYLRYVDGARQKWEITHARVDYPDLKLFGRTILPLMGWPQLTITVKEREPNGATGERHD